MKRFLSMKLAALLVAVTMLLSLSTPMAWAAESCTIGFDDPTVTVGNNVTINVYITGNVAAATIRMVYDQSYLEFVSGNVGYGSGGGGMVVLDNEEPKSFSMTFRTLKTGSTTITCAGYDIVDGNGDPMAVNMGWSAVTINAAPTASSNNNLSSLSISPGTLSPSFSAGTTSYKAYVSNSTTSVAVSAKTEDGAAKMVYWGNSGFKVGDNTVTVQVTAENGAKKFYTITVNRAGSSTGNTDGEETPETTPSPEPTPDNTVYVTLPDGIQLTIATQLPEGVAIPQGFEQSQVEYQGQTFPCIALAELSLTAVYLEGDEAHPAGFYFLDQETGTVRVLSQLAMGQRQLILMDLPQELELPQGYAATEVDLGGVQHTVLAPEGVEEPNHYIVYALDQDGQLGMYLYDVEQDSYQRYQFIELAEETEEPEQPEEPVETGFVFSILGWRVQTTWNDQTVSYVMAGLSVLSFLLLAAVVVLAVLLVRSRRALQREWMYQEERLHRQIQSDPASDDLSLDDILAEYKDEDTDE